jgi:hypothetical protein
MTSNPHLYSYISELHRYSFEWNKDLYIGIALPHEKAKLYVEASKDIVVEVQDVIVEEGSAVIPVRLTCTCKETKEHTIKFMFVE